MKKDKYHIPSQGHVQIDLYDYYKHMKSTQNQHQKENTFHIRYLMFLNSQIQKVDKFKDQTIH